MQKMKNVQLVFNGILNRNYDLIVHTDIGITGSSAESIRLAEMHRHIST